MIDNPLNSFASINTLNIAPHPPDTSVTFIIVAFGNLLFNILLKSCSVILVSVEQNL